MQNIVPLVRLRCHGCGIPIRRGPLCGECRYWIALGAAIAQAERVRVEHETRTRDPEATFACPSGKQAWFSAR